MKASNRKEHLRGTKRGSTTFPIHPKRLEIKRAGERDTHSNPSPPSPERLWLSPSLRLSVPRPLSPAAPLPGRGIFPLFAGGLLVHLGVPLPRPVLGAPSAGHEDHQEDDHQADGAPDGQRQEQQLREGGCGWEDGEGGG